MRITQSARRQSAIAASEPLRAAAAARDQAKIGAEIDRAMAR